MGMQLVIYVRKNEETLDHFILTCSKLDSIREPLLVEIINTCSQLFAKHKIDVKLDHLTLIIITVQIRYLAV